MTDDRDGAQADLDEGLAHVDALYGPGFAVDRAEAYETATFALDRAADAFHELGDQDKKRKPASLWFGPTAAPAERNSYCGLSGTLSRCARTNTRSCSLTSG